jgi:hypothetical protein
MVLQFRNPRKSRAARIAAHIDLGARLESRVPVPGQESESQLFSGIGDPSGRVGEIFWCRSDLPEV